MSNGTHGQQFTLYAFKGYPPNGWKVLMILEELGLSYHIAYLDQAAQEHRGPEHTKLNPNGRTPTLVDHHNGDFIIWESDAIITYLVEKYDRERKISFDNFEEKSRLSQWLFFQASGQGPYYGQAAWFKFMAPEKIPSAIDRYTKETFRILGVLNGVLEKREWLVGNKCSAADLSFIVFNELAFNVTLKDVEGFNLEKDYPAVHKWHTRLMDRDAVKKVYAIRDATLVQ